MACFEIVFEQKYSKWNDNNNGILYDIYTEPNTSSMDVVLLSNILAYTQGPSINDVRKRQEGRGRSEADTKSTSASKFKHLEFNLFLSSLSLSI